MKTLSFLILLFISTRISGQGFTAGLIAGISTSQVSGDFLSGFNQIGVAAGAFSNYKFNEKYSGQFELLFIQKGSRDNIHPEKGDYSFYLIRLNYVEVPLLLQYTHKQFIFEAGPGFGQLVSSREENENGTLPIQRPFYKTEISTHIGINYSFKGKIHLNWRYSNSLLPIRPHAAGSVYWSNRGQYNSVLSFTLRYRFYAGNKT